MSVLWWRWVRGMQRRMVRDNRMPVAVHWAGVDSGYSGRDGERTPSASGRRIA